MRLWRIVKEMNDAVIRLTYLRLSHATGLAGRLPDSYAEFLLLTSTARRREPSARQRALGCAVRLWRSGYEGGRLARRTAGLGQAGPALPGNGGDLLHQGAPMAERPHWLTVDAHLNRAAAG